MPLDRETFSPYGDVIETDGAAQFGINAGTIRRFHDLATVDVGEAPPARVAISITRSLQCITLPYRIPLLERHPLGSQAFFPLDHEPVLIVVASPGNKVSPGDVKAFLTNGRQGFNYHRGVWHLPLITLKVAQEMLVIDREGPGNNCEEFIFAGDELVLDL
ncbi:MAG: ureidoglycolate lyase [Gammaproteobacteria bacterium]|nr:ureidoglycolate lyase [Gammaproteobacteria bacterium]